MEKIEFRIRGPHYAAFPKAGPTVVMAYRVLPGLVIHRSPDLDGWRLAHEETTFAIGPTYDSMEDAVAAALSLKGIADFTAPADEVRKYKDAIRDALGALHRYD